VIRLILTLFRTLLIVFHKSNLDMNREGALRTLKSGRELSRKATKPVVNVFATIWNLGAIIFVFAATLVSMLTWKNLRGHTVKNGAKRKNNMNWFYHQCMKRFILTVNPFWKREVDFEVPAEELKENTYLYVCNHLSYSDFIMLSGVADINYVGVGKSDLLHMPLVGKVFQNNGFLPVEFQKRPDGRWGTKPGSTEKLMKLSRKSLESDISIILFPEGKIQLDYDLAEFKPGFFKLAIETDTPVVPIGSWGNQFIWPMMKSAVPSSRMQPGYSFVKFGTPIEPLNPQELEGMSNPVEITNYLVDKYSLTEEELEYPELETVIQSVSSYNADVDENGDEKMYTKLVVSLFSEICRRKVMTLRLDCEEKWAKQEKKRMKAEDENDKYYVDLMENAIERGRDALKL